MPVTKKKKSFSHKLEQPVHNMLGYGMLLTLSLVLLVFILILKNVY